MQCNKKEIKATAPSPALVLKSIQDGVRVLHVLLGLLPHIEYRTIFTRTQDILTFKVSDISPQNQCLVARSPDAEILDTADIVSIVVRTVLAVLTR